MAAVNGPDDSPKALLRRNGLEAKHSWGQNFLGDARALEDIVAVANLQPDEPVVELGAGLGHLTQVLLATGAKVIAVERDRDLAKVLRNRFANLPRLTVLEANAAELDFAKAAQTDKVAVIGNLPYHLSSSILFQVLEQRLHISRAVFTLQKEVVQRIAAAPGGREYGLLSALLQLFFAVELEFLLPAHLFHPPPRVDSAVLSLWALEKPKAAILDQKRYVKVVKAGFAHRRKTLLNSLKSDASLGSAQQLVAALEKANIDPMRRAETLASEEFAAIERALGGEGGSEAEADLKPI